MIKNVGEIIFQIFGHNASLYGYQHLDERPHEMGGILWDTHPSGHIKGYPYVVQQNKELLWVYIQTGENQTEKLQES